MAIVDDNYRKMYGSYYPLYGSYYLDRIKDLKEENEKLRGLCMEFASIGRVSVNNSHKLRELCDQYHELNQSIKQEGE